MVSFQLCLTLALFKLTTITALRRFFSPRDSIAITFCGVHKSLTLGIPILRILYDGSPDLGAVCLPLLVYHPTQILLGGFLVPHFKSYISRKTSR